MLRLFIDVACRYPLTTDAVLVLLNVGTVFLHLCLFTQIYIM